MKKQISKAIMFKAASKQFSLAKGEIHTDEEKFESMML
jgi:hypothetical protein